MNDTADPRSILERRRAAPPGGRTLWVAGAGETRLRLMVWPDPGARASVVIVPGRAEFIERYFEVVAELRDRGFAVAVPDMRNHGLSDRPLANPEKHHATDFAPLVLDLARILERLATEGLAAPVGLLAHSLGAHLVLRLLHDRPDLAERAVLTAPMMGIRTSPAPPALARVLVSAACRLGLAESYAPGQGDWQGGLPRERLRRRLTSDADRFADEDFQIARNPALRLGGVTYGWLDAAYRSMRLMAQPGYAETIRTTALFVLAGREKVVDNRAARAFAQRMPESDIAEIAGARHEILREADAYRAQFWRVFDRFTAPLGAG